MKITWLHNGPSIPETVQMGYSRATTRVAPTGWVYNGPMSCGFALAKVKSLARVSAAPIHIGEKNELNDCGTARSHR